MTGTVCDTDVAALQHDIAEIPSDAVKLGVVRRPTPWLHSEANKNMSALAPPEELLDVFKDRYEITGPRFGRGRRPQHRLRYYKERFLPYLEESDKALDAINDIRERLIMITANSFAIGIGRRRLRASVTDTDRHGDKESQYSL